MSDILNTAVFIGHNECYGVSAQQVEQAIARNKNSIDDLKWATYKENTAFYLEQSKNADI